MASDLLTVPDWLNAKCAMWLDRLRMDEWDIKIKLALTLNEDPDCRGTAEAFSDINLGLLEFRADIDESEEWEITIVHELLHIKHWRIDDVIGLVLAPHIQAPDVMVQTVYRMAMEPFIDSMAKALVRLARVEE